MLGKNITFIEWHLQDIFPLLVGSLHYMSFSGYVLQENHIIHGHIWS